MKNHWLYNRGLINLHMTCIVPLSCWFRSCRTSRLVARFCRQSSFDEVSHIEYRPFFLPWLKLWSYGESNQWRMDFWLWGHCQWRAPSSASQTFSDILSW
ncbi:hypothetical protein SAY86_022899 [Trapa natans]|uniref:Uncharacterized protein n=1 Tax=Trapa natans TaxID=22666 RepID=A0AAN7LWC8_TRANT|nr:hypothetical protein SAY86_022899 [Trapa natans]